MINRIGKFISIFYIKIKFKYMKTSEEETKSVVNKINSRTQKNNEI
jgi:hypothetical protein